MRQPFQILSLLAGIVFLISGIGKSLATFEFSQILMQYGFDGFRFLAPVVIVFEVAAGMLLFFNILPRVTSFLALCFISAATIAFQYGYHFLNITDCGCFGHFSFLNMSPVFTFVRNVVLMCILLFIFFKSGNLKKYPDKIEMSIMISIMCAVCFVTGYTYVEQTNDSTQYVTVEQDIETSVLCEFIETSEDSAYFVFVFSYTCPHCYNSVENLKQYEYLGVADKVIALSFAQGEAAMSRFNEIFKPNFQIKNYPHKELFRLTNQFPVSYYIKNNVIKMEIHGILPCGYLMKHKIDDVK
jgi:uncharacterized membrane protein YphA (DoxX/SURF4 family)